VVGSEQDLHFQQLFAILQLLGVPQAQQCYHLSYGLIEKPGGGKMSSRAGEAFNADEAYQEIHALVLEELTKRNPEIDTATRNNRARVIALSAMKFFMTRQDAKKPIEYNPKESISFEGQTGPYMLYTIARSYSLMRKAETKPNDALAHLLSTEKEKELLYLLAKKADVFADTTAHFSPHILVQYLLEIANAFNSYYHETHVIQENKELEAARLALVHAVQCVLEEGMYCLNIETLKEM
jgi:arginyl-tRNA synthetase